MNAFATLTFIYLLFTLFSSGILYISFRKKIDASAVYFLISELCMAITSAVLFLINFGAISPNHILTGIPNFSSICAELAIVFSILSLSKKIEQKWFLLSTLGIVAIVIFFEILRSHVPIQAIILMLLICLTSLFSLTYYICKFRLPNTLLSNPFMKLFTLFELGMIGYGVVRIILNFIAPPIVPRDTPTSLATMIFSFYVVMGTFRYISYIGLRITWIDPQNPTQNLLNRPLAKAIDEKDQLLRGLIASNRAIGISALASSLAHQLSQPLTTIALRADTTKRDLAKSGQDPKVITSLDEISTQSTKLAELVKNLRQLFGSQSHEFAPLNLQKHINEIIEIVEPSLNSKKITLTTHYQSNPTVFGDGIQLQQVLINVLNNAIDALAPSDVEPKEIIVNLTNDEKFAVLTIKDNGVGIDPKTLASIFELYKTTKKGGLGVGLWLSKTIMENHHGSIFAYNDPNGGATFKMSIPMHRTLSE